MLFLQHPAECPPVVGEQLPDALVSHLLAFELFGEEVVLLSDLGFRSHNSTLDRTRLQIEESPAPDYHSSMLATPTDHSVVLSRRFFHRERLSPEQFAVERRVFGEMMDDHVASTSRKTGLLYVTSRERPGK